MMLATLFYNPIVLPASMTIWMLLPLCLIIAIVYKTLRVETTEHLIRQILFLFAYMVAGLTTLAVGAWLVVSTFL